MNDRQVRAAALAVLDPIMGKTVSLLMSFKACIDEDYDPRKVMKEYEEIDDAIEEVYALLRYGRREV